LIKKVIREDKRIILNGNGYDDAWLVEAEKRGLLNLRTTPDCLPQLLAKKNVELFTTHKVFSEIEIRSRYEILMENYSNVINIEALTMVDMAKKDILPAVSKYSHELAETATAKKAFVASADCYYEEELVEKLSTLGSLAYKKVKALEDSLMGAKDISDTTELAVYYKDKVFVAMSELRIVVDELETLTSAEYWPYPSYGELLFGVR
ncbi:MAG: glutamine synthetase, partial [Oscillospiraceae bacterium]